MKKILLAFGACLLLLNVGCAVKSPRLQTIVQSRIKETRKDTIQYSNIEIKINKNIELADQYKQEKSSYIPALLYWGWNSEIQGEFSKGELTNQIGSIAKSKIGIIGLDKNLENKKLIISMDELPSKFKFQHKGDVAILIVAYFIKEKKYIATEAKDFKGNYKVVDEQGKVVLEKDFVYTNKFGGEGNANKLAKKLAWLYIDSYNTELDRVTSLLLEDVKANLETNSLTQKGN